MRQHGINLPEPDASGNINFKGINQQSAHYNETLAICVREIPSAKH